MLFLKKKLILVDILLSCPWVAQKIYALEDPNLWKTIFFNITVGENTIRETSDFFSFKIWAWVPIRAWIILYSFQQQKFLHHIFEHEAFQVVLDKYVEILIGFQQRHNQVNVSYTIQLKIETFHWNYMKFSSLF